MAEHRFRVVQGGALWLEETRKRDGEDTLDHPPKCFSMRFLLSGLSSGCLTALATL